jgi:hypothetical protein
MSDRSHWAIVNRGRGEAQEQWRKRCREAYREQWQQEKIRSGEWLPAEEYAKQAGRPGKKLAPLDEHMALARREQATQSATQPPTEASSSSRRQAPSSSPTHEAVFDMGRGAARDAAAGAGMAVLQHVIRKGTSTDPLEAARAAASAGAQSAVKGVVTRGVEQAIGEGIRRVSPTLLQEATKQAVQASGKELAKQAARSTLRGNAVAAAAGLVVEQGIQTAYLLTGKINGTEYGRRSLENVASSGGSLGGSALGAAIGTVLCPGLGTAVGAALFGIAGSMGGSKLARWLAGLEKGKAMGQNPDLSGYTMVAISTEQNIVNLLPVVQWGLRSVILLASPRSQQMGWSDGIRRVLEKRGVTVEERPFSTEQDSIVALGAWVSQQSLPERTLWNLGGGLKSQQIALWDLLKRRVGDRAIYPGTEGNSVLIEVTPNGPREQTLATQVLGGDRPATHRGGGRHLRPSAGPADEEGAEPGR